MGYYEMFRTGQKVYEFNPSHPHWRTLPNGDIHALTYFPGSIDPSKNPAFQEPDQHQAFLDQLRKGRVPGFEPLFEVGRVPIGVVITDLDHILVAEQNRLVVREALRKPFEYYVGKPITEIASTATSLPPVGIGRWRNRG